MPENKRSLKGLNKDMPEKKEIRLSEQQLMDSYRNEQAKMDFLQRRMQEMQQVLNEIVTAAEAVKELRKTKKEENILVSLGAGIYAEAKIGGTGKVKTSLAGNVLLDEESEAAEKKLQAEREKVEASIRETFNEQQATMQNIQNFENIFRQVRQKMSEQNVKRQPAQESGPRSVS
jgi:prefoldin alpha subunit